MLKCGKGIGETYIYNFKLANSDEKTLLEAIKIASYDDEDYEDRILQESVLKYYQFICERIVYFVATSHHIMILRMRVEFLKDDDGKL